MKRSLIAALTGLMVACTIVMPPPPVVEPPPPPPPAVELGALDVSTLPRFPGISILIDGQPFTAAPETNCLQTDASGAGFCSNVPVGMHVVTIGNLPEGAIIQNDASIPVFASTTSQIVFQVSFPAPPPPPPPPPGWLVALKIEGVTFTENGKPWIYRGFTDFLLYQKFLAGDNLDAILRERVGVGANVVRVLGMVTSFSHFHPQEHADYYDRLRPFADTLASYGLRVEFVVFADAQVVMPDTAAEQAHIDRVIAAFGTATNVLIEVCNEPFKNIPGGSVAASALAQRIVGRGFLVATGNYDYPDPGTPVPYSADYLTNHPERKPEWPRTSKDQYDFNEVYHKPVVSDEPMGAAETDSGSRSAQPDDFAYFAAESALAGAGGTFHSDSGVRSETLGSVQRLSARAFFDAMKWVPVEAQRGAYQRGEANGGPGINNMPLEHTDALALRTFCKLANGDEYCVVIRPDSSWVATPRDGWRILDQTGPHGALVHLGR